MKHTKTSNSTATMATSDDVSKLEAEMLTIMKGDISSSTIDPTNFLMTDAGNANLFVALHGENLRYVEAWDCWMFWEGKLWKERSDISLLSMAIEITELMLSWVDILPPDHGKQLRKHALSSQRRERLKAMIDVAKGNESVRAKPGQFDADPWLLGCGETTYNLKTGISYPSKRYDYITKSTSVAPNFEMNCPNWKSLLHWALRDDEETIEHIQRSFGYMLTGDISEEKLFSFFGSGANGKTTIGMTLYEIMGSYADKARSDLLVQSQGRGGSASPDISALEGMRLVVATETDDHNQLAESQVKTITSNEPIPSRKLYHAKNTFYPTHKILLMTNHRPFVKGMDDGIWRRLNIIGFNATLPEDKRNPRYREEILRPELPAILAWAIEGCAMWQKDGLKPSPAVKSATDNYRQEMDIIGNWLNERTELDLNAKLSRSEAYMDFKNWTQNNYVPLLSNSRFKAELEARGFKGTVIRGDRKYIGLKIRYG